MHRCMCLVHPFFWHSGNTQKETEVANPSIIIQAANHHWPVGTAVNPAVCSPKSMVNGQVRRPSLAATTARPCPDQLGMRGLGLGRSQPRSQPEADRQDNVATRRLRSPSSRYSIGQAAPGDLLEAQEDEIECSCWLSPLSFWAPNAITSSATPADALHLHTAARANTRSQVSRV